MEYKVLGISAGLGVSLFPFKKELIGNVEGRSLFHTPKNDQWRLNFGGITLYKDYSMLTREETTCTDKYGDPDVVISSPDCGSGSVFRYSRSKKLGDHTKNDSLMAFFVGIKRFRPKFFYFENLDGLFKSFPKERFIDLTRDYRLLIHNESVSKWGNAQINRKRLVIIGIRHDLPKKLDKYFRLPNIKGKKTCEELYGDLGKEQIPELCHVREPIHQSISIHARKKMTLEEIANHWNNRLKGKKRWYTEPGFNFTTAPGVYRNLKKSFPATARKANRQFDHRGLTLSPRQLARVQGIPDEFKLYYDPKKSQYCINKARTVVTKTPPMEISVWFKRKLDKSLKLWQKLN